MRPPTRTWRRPRRRRGRTLRRRLASHRTQLHRHAFGVDGAQQLDRLESLFLIELADRETDVDDHVVAELHLGT